MTTQREQLSIVVVDDMKFNCALIRRALLNEGYEDIRVAASANEALELLQQMPADVVLADWVMPQMDGLELAEHIRHIDEELERYTCIVLLTAKDDINSLLEAFERGVDDYVIKPPNDQELAARVYAAGRIAHMQNDLLDMMRTMRLDIEQRVTVDRVTGLGNRLDAERRLTDLLQLVESRGGAMCCGYLSMNDSESLRARYGEEVYEAVLCSIARRLRRSVRPGDVVARISDHEFVVGMYYQEQGQIRGRTFKRVMQAINLRPFKTEAGFLSVSVAMAMCCNREG
ncbi:MAG TPA: response regulator, partial [Gammaproteobacteria bacterium]